MFDIRQRVIISRLYMNRKIYTSLQNLNNMMKICFHMVIMNGNSKKTNKNIYQIHFFLMAAQKNHRTQPFNSGLDFIQLDPISKNLSAHSPMNFMSLSTSMPFTISLQMI